MRRDGCSTLPDLLTYWIAFMSSRIIEYYGWEPNSIRSVNNASSHFCPFIKSKCTKNITRSLGACSLQLGDSDPVIICPNRLYAEDFRILSEISQLTFGEEAELLSPNYHEIRRRSGSLNGREIVVFGKNFGKELGIPTPPGLYEGDSRGNFFIDFILAKLDVSGNVENFAAVEVQTIDTTGSYAEAAAAYKSGIPYGQGNGVGLTNAGLNWENVSKRILPQLIYKGHALRREPRCNKGLFFVLPQAVFQRIKRRVGGNLLEYPQSAGTITFRTYDLGAFDGENQRTLEFRETFTTTVEQIAFAFVSPRNLPVAGVYETVINNTIAKMRRKKSI
jgi:hypothetical protein